MKVPILILSNNRPLMLANMIKSIEAYTDPETYHIIICDNNSTQKEMIELLKKLEKTHTVLRNKSNRVFEGLNIGLKIVKQYHDKYFIISDPDLLLTPAIPKNWVQKMCEILDNSTYPKVGLALNIKFAIDNEWVSCIRSSEGKYWQAETKFEFIEDICYEAPVDTTMALYRYDTFEFWQDGSLHFDRAHGIEGEGWIGIGHFNKKYKNISLRIAGRFTVEHLGWWIDKKYFVDFPYYYQNSEACKISSSFLAERLGLLILTLTKEEVSFLFNSIEMNIKQQLEERFRVEFNKILL